MPDKGAAAPDAGDLVRMTFSPQRGHEQSGRRPALVLSPVLFNAHAGLALVCPITSQVKGYPFEVPLPSGLPVAGVILVDHVKSLDWIAREAVVIGRVPRDVLEDVTLLLLRLLPDVRR